MPQPLQRLYVNNVPYIFDPDAGVFSPDDRARPKLTTAEIEKTPGRYHVSSYSVWLLNGEAYYHNTRLKQFELIGVPCTTISYDAYDDAETSGKPYELSQPDDFADILPLIARQQARTLNDIVPKPPALKRKRRLRP